ncbi:MAG TPA: CdaR family protein, partial [Bdellovibrionota bacterium]|nr:CdaR family protein [Bdellovibrionota bacterium]
MIEKVWNLVTANIGTKVISVMIALVLWTIVMGSRNVEVVKEVPLEVITAADVVASNEVPERIQFRLSGPKAFLRAIEARREEPIRVNLTSAKPGHLVTYNFFSNSIRVPIGVKVLSINPAALLVKLEYVKRRDVPVRVETRGNVPDGFKLVRTEVVPATVRVKGAESRVDSLGEISTIPIDLTGLKSNLEKEVAIDLPRYNVQLDGPLPKVVLEIDAESANYRIKNVDIRYQSPFKVRLDEKSVVVWVRAEEKDLKSLDRARVFASVELAGKKKGH